MAAEHSPEVTQGLKLIRIRQRRMGHVLLGLVPFVLVAGYISHLASPSDLETSFIAVAALYGALMLAYSWRLAFTHCPRCDGFYHCSWWLDAWTQRCLHCGLSLKE